MIIRWRILYNTTWLDENTAEYNVAEKVACNSEKS